MEDFDLAKVENIDASDGADGYESDCGSPMVGILMIGIIYSVLSAIVAILLGAGFWTILASYSGGGAAAMIVSAVIVAFNRRRASHACARYSRSYTS
ncbi:hypothetical protein [Primorskyibacter marinus]|uniref:hypothetical protein n=1 Tax=Primorskyibacter marinus TaxID=1977320 RepID=UPI00130083B4|nr:hypothetical protein [Primorskyibacter marinus]